MDEVGSGMAWAQAGPPPRIVKQAFGDPGEEAPCGPFQAWRKEEASLNSRAMAFPAHPVKVPGAGPSVSLSCLKQPQGGAGCPQSRKEQEHYPLLGPQVSRAGVTGSG